MSAGILRYIGAVICAVLSAGCAKMETLLGEADLPCTVKVSGIVIDGTAGTPLSAIDVRMELFSPGASSAHSMVSSRTDDAGRYELEMLYGDAADRCFITVPGGAHLGILYDEYKVEVMLLRDSAGYDKESSTYTVEKLPIVLARK